MKSYRKRIGSIVFMVTALLLSIGFISAPVSHAADTTVPELLITEVANYDTTKLYEYVEIYNTTDKAINLKDYILQYYTSDFDKPANRWLVSDKKIEPRSTLVLWLKNFDNPNNTLSDFNAHYQTSLTEDQVFQVKLTTSAQGLHKTAPRKIGIAKPDGTLISFAVWNQNGIDNEDGTTNYYKYPEKGIEMTLFKTRQKPNPGSLVKGQLLGEVDPNPNSAAGSGITQEALDLSGRKPLNIEFLNKASEGPVIPGLKQDYTPQGIAYEPKNNWIMNSYYLDGKPSIISITDLSTGKLVKAMPLYSSDSTPYTGHAGGIAISKQHVWISSGSKVYKIKLEDIINAKDGDKLIFSEIIPTETKGSYVNYADGVLWVGEFGRLNDDNYKTVASHHKKDRDGNDQIAWIAGYKLNADDTMDPMAAPDYILSTQDEIQDMIVIQDKIVLSRSYGRSNMSDFLIYQNPLSEAPHELVQVNGKSVPLWFLDRQNIGQRMILPPMLEDACELNGKVYILFESGATQYRGDGLYPVDRYYILDTAQLLNGFVVPNPDLYPVPEKPKLLMTEIANYDDTKLYEYVEIYNITNQTIDLDGYLLWYYTTNMQSHANEWPIRNKKIGPYQTLVLWLKTTSDPNWPLSEFNKHYGVDLTDNQVFQVMLTTSGQGLHKTAKRKLAIAKPGTAKGGPVIISAEYNDELDENGNVIVDNVNGTTNYYRYPESGNQMVKFKTKQKPNPGAPVPGQVPDPNLHLNLQAAAGDKKATLSWEPAEIDLNGYRVYKNGKPVSDSVATVTSGVYSFTVENLTNSTNYEFAVTGILMDQNGKPMRETLPSNTVRVTPMSSPDIKSIRSMIGQYVSDGQLKGSLAPQLTNSLDQAEHQFSKGSTKQAIKFLQDFLKHLDNEPMRRNVTEIVKENLKTSVQALIASWSI